MNLISKILIEWLPTILECITVVAAAIKVLSKTKPLDEIGKLTRKIVMLNEKIDNLKEELKSLRLEAKGVKHVGKN